MRKIGTIIRYLQIEYNKHRDMLTHYVIVVLVMMVGFGFLERTFTVQYLKNDVNRLLNRDYNCIEANHKLIEIIQGKKPSYLTDEYWAALKALHEQNRNVDDLDAYLPADHPPPPLRRHHVRH